MGVLNSNPTHAIIFFNSTKGLKETGIGAMMKICFGSDDDALAQILYRTTPGSKTPVWTLPVRPAPGDIAYPIFQGKLGEEIMAVVGRTADRFKKGNMVTPYAGNTYRITAKGVEKITAEVKTTDK